MWPAAAADAANCCGRICSGAAAVRLQVAAAGLVMGAADAGVAPGVRKGSLWFNLWLWWLLVLCKLQSLNHSLRRSEIR